MKSLKLKFNSLLVSTPPLCLLNFTHPSVLAPQLLRVLRLKVQSGELCITAGQKEYGEAVGSVPRWRVEGCDSIAGDLPLFFFFLLWWRFIYLSSRRRSTDGLFVLKVAQSLVGNMFGWRRSSGGIRPSLFKKKKINLLFIFPFWSQPRPLALAESDIISSVVLIISDSWGDKKGGNNKHRGSWHADWVKCGFWLIAAVRKQIHLLGLTFP